MSVTYTRDEIEQRVFDTLVSFEIPPEAIVPEANLRTLDIDSLDVVEVAETIRGMGVDIEARDFIEVTTYGEFIDVIMQRARLV